MLNLSNVIVPIESDVRIYVFKDLRETRPFKGIYFVIILLDLQQMFCLLIVLWYPSTYMTSFIKYISARHA